VLARKIRAEIETLLPASVGKLARIAQEFRLQVSERIGNAFARRRFWERVFDGGIASAMRRGGENAGRDAIATLLQQASRTGDPTGEAWLVGAGPGDPELLTLRAVQLMQAADVILYDRLVSEAILNMARRDALRISVGKIPGSEGKNS
jgi:uroporphyrin-III C-methyltransferase/precorrin-2 dehydrogenase/sirohydrochlorin ferrochelatase